MNFDSANFDISNPAETLVIAEVGVNHNGNLETALRMVDEAKKRGAHIVKFQAFVSENEISRFADKAAYQKETTGDDGGQLEMCKKLELGFDALREIREYCKQIRMPFLCAAFDYDSLDFLTEDLRLETIKIASSEVTNIPFLRLIGSRKKSVILSTGASTLTETGLAIETLRKAGCPELLVFHCVSSYPAPYGEVNLRSMTTIRDAFQVPTGFSDHTIGSQVAIAAAALGASAVEKHFTLDRNQEGPDHRSSIEPDELEALVKGVKIANICLGSGLKVPAPCEMPNLKLIRKGMVASRDLPAGTILTPELVEFKRPETGIIPADLEKALGLKLGRAISQDEPIDWKDLI